MLWILNSCTPIRVATRRERITVLLLPFLTVDAEPVELIVQEIAVVVVLRSHPVAVRSELQRWELFRD